MGPLIPLSIGVGIARGVLGARRAKKEKQRRSALIQQAFGIANERLNTAQNDTRQSQMESLVGRGLLQGGSADLPDGAAKNPELPPPPGAPLPAHVQAAQTQVMLSNPVAREQYLEAQRKKKAFDAGRAPADAARKGGDTRPLSGTIATQELHDQEQEFGLERKDLEAQRNAAMSDVRAAYESAITDAIVGSIGTGVGVYNMGQSLTAADTSVAPAKSPIREAMIGVDDPGAWWGGINGLNPLGGDSSWNRQGTVVAAGQSNVDFRLG